MHVTMCLTSSTKSTKEGLFLWLSLKSDQTDRDLITYYARKVTLSICFVCGCPWKMNMIDVGGAQGHKKIKVR